MSKRSQVTAIEITESLQGVYAVFEVLLVTWAGAAE